MACFSITFWSRLSLWSYVSIFEQAKLARNGRDGRLEIEEPQEDYIERHVTHAIADLEKILASDTGKRILEGEARMRWAFDTDAVREVAIKRPTKVRSFILFYSLWPN